MVSICKTLGVEALTTGTVEPSLSLQVGIFWVLAMVD